MKLQPQMNAPGPMAVAVPTLTPAFALLCLQPVDGYAAGTLRPVMGWNVRTGNVLTNGSTPPEWRNTVEDGDYENEVLFGPLPNTVEDMNPDDYPGCYQLVLTDYKLIPVPVPELTKPTGKVVKHTATIELEKAKAAKQQAVKVLPLFPDYPTINQTA